MLGADILFFKEHTLSYYGIPSILEVPRPNHNSENHKNMFQDIFLNIHILFYHITRTRSGLSSHVGLVMIFYHNACPHLKYDILILKSKYPFCLGPLHKD